jgi:hypothetical protein
MPMQRRPAARIVRTTKATQLARLQSPDSASELSDPVRIRRAGLAAESESRWSLGCGVVCGLGASGGGSLRVWQRRR